MNPRNTMALAAGIVIVVLVVALIIAYYVSELIDHWDAKRNPPGPDVGVDIVDCGMVHDCDGCDECGAPMVIEEDATGIQLAEYGDRLIHRHCLDARRDGRTPCAECAPVMAGAR